MFEAGIEQEPGAGFNHAVAIVNVQEVPELLDLSRGVWISRAQPAMIHRDGNAPIAGLNQQRQTIFGAVVGQAVGVIADYHLEFSGLKQIGGHKVFGLGGFGL